MTWFRLKGCPKCHGDLASDEGDWLCLQCGTYYYTGLYVSGPSGANRPTSGPEAGSESNGRLTHSTDQGSTKGPDYPSQRREKDLIWALGARNDMAGAAPGFTASTVNRIHSIDLAMRRQ